MFEYFRTFARRRRDVSRASVVEYGVLVAGIVVVIAVAVFAFTGLVKSATNTTCSDAADTSSVASGSCTP